MKDKILPAIALGAALTAMPLQDVQAQKSSKVEKSYYPQQVFSKDSTSALDEKVNMAKFSIDKNNSREISKTVDDYGNFKIIKQGEFPNEKVVIFYEEKLLGKFQTDGMSLRQNPTVPKAIFDLYTGVTELKKQLDCKEKENKAISDSLATLQKDLLKTNNFRRFITFEPGIGFDVGQNGLQDEFSQPLISANASAIVTFGGKQWTLRPALYASLPLNPTKILVDNLSTYVDRHDSPSGRFYVETTREVAAKKQATRDFVVGGGFRLYPGKKSDFHIDVLAGLAPNKYVVKSSTQERDLSKEVYNADGFFLGDENASLQTYDLKSRMKFFDNYEVKLGIGKGRGALYATYGILKAADGKTMNYVGLSSHIKFGLGKRGNK